MPDILFHYERVNPTSWAYLSSLLMLALYFKFNRVWSVRNIDLFLLILLAPGLLLVQWSWENMMIAENAPKIEYLGFIWLFATGAVLLMRLLLDSAMVRRPLLEPNLNAAGLIFLGSSLLFFLMANVVTGDPSAEDLLPARSLQQVAEDELEAERETDSFATDGPGFRLLYGLPRISTQTVISAGSSQERKTPSEQDRQERRIEEATTRVMAILSHVMIVAGMVVIGHMHYDNITMGIAAATLYLLLPYTALWTGSPEHALPASVLVWSIALYRRPLVSGMMIGLAAGTIYYPAFLVPLWCSFYWERGLKRFISGVLVALLVLVLTLAFTAASSEQFFQDLLQMFGMRLPTISNLRGIWEYWNPVYRFPLLAAFVALAFSFTIWPVHKSLATLMSGTAAIMLGAQFWHPYDGGVFIAWYLPLLLLVIFRPNLEDSVALTKVSEGWWALRRRMRESGAVPVH